MCEQCKCFSELRNTLQFSKSNLYIVYIDLKFKIK